ncbi:aryl-alcohol dehydrogenase-like predicted oxidoreductase [Nocardioides luteus]|uniref:Aldo/keto reductase n=1 Tax=Nocardioides luteus TaxID=1844 RepID=A0ABQ5SWM9_9ACTN|nr:aldo/keto reductase [Nocardioides luteus]MDR7312332.1 aryl-alcohol dehydrogenase-like predicted oxidoreductase [Nocardioides luteus]GGR57768.1 aldo/keto reductase [Nocardioides luteus]GLJ68577.1 aldo/keto reductase [Nocardioides luteus]
MPLDHYRTLGRSGLRVSPLALGAMNFDDGSWGTAPADAFSILDRYFDLGGNFVDTANAYNGGQSEEVLGRYFAERPERRQRAVLATKFGGTMRPDDPNAGGASRKAIHEEIDASLRRLRTDYVDLYWMHQWDRHTPMEETLSTLDDLVRAGKVRAIGVSNTPAWWVARAVTLAEWRDRTPIAALQDEYSLLARTPEGEQFGLAKELGLAIVPWSPLASGALSGKYTRATPTAGDSRRGAHVAPHVGDALFDLVEVMEEIADDAGGTVAGVALAWVRQQDAVTSTLIGPRTVDQLNDNLASIDIDLNAEHLARLSAMTTPTLDYPMTVMDSIALPFQYGPTTINGLTSRAFQR